MSSQKLLHKKDTIIIYCLGFARQILKEFKPQSLRSPRGIACYIPRGRSQSHINISHRLALIYTDGHEKS